MNSYDQKYAVPEYYWGKKPSNICFKVLQMMPPEKHLKLLDIGCGEGRNTIFFARNGYQVTAFDLSKTGVEKTKSFAEEIGISVNAFQADLLEHRLSEKFDIFFASGVLHYIPEEQRTEILSNYKQFTRLNGLHVFNVFVRKPFIGKSPDAEGTGHVWISGELFTHYQDWKIEYCTEEIFDCNSSGVPHKHAVNRIIARNVEELYG